LVGPEGQCFGITDWPLTPGGYVNAAAMHPPESGSKPGLSGYRMGHHARINMMVQKHCDPPECAKWLIFRARTADLRDEDEHSVAPEGWVEMSGSREEVVAWLAAHGADVCLLPWSRAVRPSLIVEGLETHGVATAGPGIATEAALGVEALSGPALATGRQGYAVALKSHALATGEQGTARAGTRGIAVGASAEAGAQGMAIGWRRAKVGPQGVIVVGCPWLGRPLIGRVGERGIEPGVWYRAENGQLVRDDEDDNASPA